MTVAKPDAAEWLELRWERLADAATSDAEHESPSGKFRFLINRFERGAAA